MKLAALQVLWRNGTVAPFCYNFSLESLGDLMTDLLKMLHDERDSLARKLASVDAAIAALNGIAVPKSATKSAPVKRTWTMSASARKKISLAQKKRWAKVKK